MNNLSISQLANQFNCSPENMRMQLTANLKGLNFIKSKIISIGKKYNGYDLNTINEAIKLFENKLK